MKLVDFGFASRKAIDNEHGLKRLLGTPLFMVPEKLRNDCWAFGILMFILLSGRPPFTQRDPDSTFRDILNGPKFDPDIWDSKSANAMNLLKKLLDADPSQRPTMKEILQD